MTTQLRELGIAVCADVSGEHGMPSTVGLSVEFDGGEYWSGHASVACSSKERVGDDVGPVFRKAVLSELARLDSRMRQSSLVTRKEHTINDIIRLSVRISYAIQQDNPHGNRRVRQRCC